MTVQELYENLSHGGEIEFEYKGKHYSITHINGRIHIMEQYNDLSEQFFVHPEEVGDYHIGNSLLREIFQDAHILFKCF